MSLWAKDTGDPRLAAARGRRLRQRFQRVTRPVWLGTLRRSTPLTTEGGVDRGTPVDRHYIEKFLEEYTADIKGRALRCQNMFRPAETVPFSVSVARS